MSARVFGGQARSVVGWSSDLNFEACSTAVDPSITSSGGANRTRVNNLGARVAADKAARINFNPVTLAPIGLLQEPGRVQLLSVPNDVSNAGWAKSFITAPSADTLRETTDNNYHLIAQFPATTAGAVVCFSLEAKVDGRNYCIAQVSDGGSNALQAGFDLNNLVTGGYALTFGTASSIQRQAIALEDGWIALQVSGIYSPTATLAAAQFYLLDAAGNSLYAGDVTKGMKVRNLNFAHGRFATSPQLSASTSTAAIHLISGAAFSQYFAPQGTYLIEFTPYALTANDVYWGIGQANVFNNSMYLVNSSGSLLLIVYSAGVNTAVLDLGTLVAGTRYKVGISYQAGEIAARCNGGVERLSSGAMPAVIDTEGLLTTPWNGGSSYPAAHMHRRRYSRTPRRSELYQLTL